MSTPIMEGKAVVGVIGFVCFTQEQKAHILDNFDMFFDFLAQMAGLLAAKVHEARSCGAPAAWGACWSISSTAWTKACSCSTGRGRSGYNRAAGSILGLDARRAMGYEGPDAQPGPQPGLRAVLRQGEEGVRTIRPTTWNAPGGPCRSWARSTPSTTATARGCSSFRRPGHAQERLPHHLGHGPHRPDVLLGESEAMAELKRQIRRFAGARPPRWSWASRARARSWWPGPCTTRAAGRARFSWPSIAAQSPKP